MHVFTGYDPIRSDSFFDLKCQKNKVANFLQTVSLFGWSRQRCIFNVTLTYRKKVDTTCR